MHKQGYVDKGVQMRQLFVAVLIATVVGALDGCAGGGAVQGICGLQPIGENEAGVQFLRYRCEPDK